MNASEEMRNQEELVSENQPAMSNQEKADHDGSENTAHADAGETAANDELQEIKDKYLRLYSEFENFRRRTSREKLEVIQAANEQLIASLLPVVDDFERAEKALGDAPSVTLEGYILIQNKLKKILAQFSVREMDIATGSDFDPESQEAISQVPAPEDKLKGKVVDVVQKGYLLNDKVIRYAKVVVGN
jgi:molecular chaperone GrpE